MKYVLLTVLITLITGCASAPERSENPTTDVLQQWENNRSDYALLEIVDAYIDPFSHTASKEEVLKYLGQGTDDPDSYLNAGPKMWVYSSSRRVPYGSHLVIVFDDQDMVKHIEWVSE